MRVLAPATALRPTTRGRTCLAAPTFLRGVRHAGTESAPMTECGRPSSIARTSPELSNLPRLRRSRTCLRVQLCRRGRQRTRRHSSSTACRDRRVAVARVAGSRPTPFGRAAEQVGQFACRSLCRSPQVPTCIASSRMSPRMSPMSSRSPVSLSAGRCRARCRAAAARLPGSGPRAPDRDSGPRQGRRVARSPRSRVAE